ncbi:ricin-type beta-trefoil lectin domain protein [Dactylosporangium sp. NPDC000521]|uniref:ricin-type beta-trefoil lectin domain protein n=1 Tax=Dactylosporangium sp. NPDC000521 TaxID=3363975 RepID=UPI0036BC111A
MSVAEDGNEQEQPGGASQRADRAARHRVPPVAAATAKVPLLPEPFNPAKPTFPAGAAIPRQRRGGPTAIATASIPVVPVEDDRPDFDALFADALGDEPEPVPAPDADAPEHAGPDQGEDPATVGTLAGEIRASAAKSQPPVEEEPAEPLVPVVPVALVKPAVESAVESPALVDPAAFEPPTAVDEPMDAAVPAAPLVGVAPVMPAADDSPTVADYVPPAIAIVTDDPAETDDGPDYRGARRRIAAWRRYPVGAVAVAVLILLITAAVVLQLVRDGDHGTPVADVSPQSYPGVGGLPEVTRDAGASPSASPSAAPSSASPTPSRSKSSAPAVPPPSASASPSKSASSAPAPPPPGASGQLVVYRDRPNPMCLTYRAGDKMAVIDKCLRAGSGNSSQRWTVRDDGSVRADGGCLDVANAGTGNGNAVQLYSCNGTAAQKWIYRGDFLYNPHSGRCLDVANSGTSAGNQVIIWDCTGSANQRWARQVY